MAKEPSRLVSDLQSAVHLMGRDTLLAAAHEVDGLQTFAERDMGRLKNGADAHGELATAMAALLETGANAALLILHAFKRVNSIQCAALWAYRGAVP